MKDKTVKIVLYVIAIGVWILVLQNVGVIPTRQNVNAYVEGGYVGVSGNVEVEGYVDVSGSVEITNEVDVDIRRINGWHAANYKSYTLDKEEYHSLGVE